MSAGECFGTGGVWLKSGQVQRELIKNGVIPLLDTSVNLATGRKESSILENLFRCLGNNVPSGTTY